MLGVAAKEVRQPEAPPIVFASFEGSPVDARLLGWFKWDLVPFL